jgi:uroporphyrinogen III methyltransferase / synthase
VGAGDGNGAECPPPAAQTAMTRVVITRPRALAGELRDALTRLGHRVELCPLIAVEPLGDEPIDVSGYDWVVLTSPNGASELRRRMTGEPRRVAAIGQATAEAFGGADLVPRRATQEGLLAELPRPVGRVLFAGAEGARPLLADSLAADVAVLYRTHALAPASFPAADLVVLASASAARAYAALAVATPAVSIGPETTRAARECGVAILAEAETHDLDGLVGAVERAAASLAASP